MKKSLSALAAVVMLSSPLALAAPAVAVTDSSSASAAGTTDGTGTTKIQRKLTRVTHSGASSFNWYGEEVVKLSPQGGGKYVYLQMKKPGGKWVNYQRQTTLANGTFNFGTYQPSQLKKFKNRYYNVGHIPNTYQHRVRVPGTSKYKALTTLPWTVRWVS